jgi:flavin-binding protein dodecin
MPKGVAKITEQIGHSDKGRYKASEVAVEEATKSIRGITEVEVSYYAGKVKDAQDHRIQGQRANCLRCRMNLEEPIFSCENRRCGPGRDQTRQVEN